MYGVVKLPVVSDTGVMDWNGHGITWRALDDMSAVWEDGEQREGRRQARWECIYKLRTQDQRIMKLWNEGNHGNVTGYWFKYSK